MKNNIDSGVFTAIQIAAAEALQNGDEFAKKMRDVYMKRRDLVIFELMSLGWDFEIPKGAFYLWVKVPVGYDSTSFASLLLDKVGVVVSPGSGYGASGEGYIRISLTVGEDKIQEAFERIRTLQI